MKHDCVFGGDLDIDEITVVSEVRCTPLSLSLSLSLYVAVTSAVTFVIFWRKFEDTTFAQQF